MTLVDETCMMIAVAAAARWRRRRTLKTLFSLQKHVKSISVFEFTQYRYLLDDAWLTVNSKLENTLSLMDKHLRYGRVAAAGGVP